jgi:hypothetical protein
MTTVQWFKEQIDGVLPAIFTQASKVDEKDQLAQIKREIEDIMPFLYNNALEMEKHNHEKTFKDSRSAHIFEKDMPPLFENFEQYWESLKQPKQ